MQTLKILLASGTAVVAWSCPVFAQAQVLPMRAESSAETTTVPQTSASADDGALMDIVVTAQKRSESINSVGMSITAATAQDLSLRQVRDVQDLVKIVPGLTYQPSPYGTPVYTIRGIGLYDNGLASSPAVSIYVDEVPLSFPAMTDGAALDVERVEVLKGPQGTLFGQNATGGAINYIAAKPTSAFAAGGSISYERFNRFEGTAFISGPITDRLRARVALRTVQSGDWQRSTTRNDTLGESNQWFGRLLVDWDATDSITFNLNINGFRNRSEPQAPQLLSNLLNVIPSATPANPFGIVDPVRYAQLTNPASAGYDPGFASRQHLVFARLAGSAGAAVAAGTRAFLGAPIAANNARAADWTPQSAYPERLARDFHQVSLRANLDLSDDVKLVSISSYAKLKSDLFQDLDATPVSALDYHQYGTVETFSQELRLVGSLNKLNWIVGGNYDHVDHDENSSPTIPLLSLNEAIPSLPFSEFDANLKQKAKTYAAFANVDLEVSPGLTVQGGVRYTNTRRRAAYCAADNSVNQNLSTTFTILQSAFSQLGLKSTPVRPVGLGQCYQLTLAPDLSASITPDQQRLNEENVSYRFGVNYKIDSGPLLYANVSRGFKSGIFSPIAGTSVSQETPAVQERVQAYEAGFKTALFGRHVQLNGAAFYYDYKDKQVRAKAIDPIFGLLEKLINVPKSTVWGFEGEIVARPFRGLNLSLGATYLKSTVEGGGTGFYNSNGFSGTFDGSRLPYTPEFMAVADAQYEWDVSDRLKASLGGTLNHQSGTNATFSTTALPADAFFIKGFTTLDLRAGIGTNDDRWKISLFGRNVTNTYYWSTTIYGSDTSYRYAARPATYGASLAVQF
ncbi:TonB-dependent receptor [Sphingobium sp. 3R8]|uniref:TonB-dependent receptor n=1 Tax=Sphingobium sp. 3R8 TaxID=2874921 RepID=UPI001CC9F042|nr:TonB-dependent receptor [Sphingobium sp. 3R8]MBZ9646904.1 TonB-dependent receptor [Sphingobium sp. 3R8]